jgi:hypothetical protein
LWFGSSSSAAHRIASTTFVEHHFDIGVSRCLGEGHRLAGLLLSDHGLLPGCPRVGGHVRPRRPPGKDPTEGHGWHRVHRVAGHVDRRDRHVHACEEAVHERGGTSRSLGRVHCDEDPRHVQSLPPPRALQRCEGCSSGRAVADPGRTINSQEDGALRACPDPPAAVNPSRRFGWASPNLTGAGPNQVGTTGRRGAKSGEYTHTAQPSARQSSRRSPRGGLNAVCGDAAGAQVTVPRPALSDRRG